MSRTQYTVALALMLCAALPAGAQFRKPEDAIKYRKSVMEVMGNHFYARLGGMANGRIPFDAGQAAENAELVATLAKLPWNAFPVGTETGKTSVKPAIWSEPEKFKDATEKLQQELAKLVVASKAGNMDNYKAAYRAASGSCKACHDHFTSE